MDNEEILSLEELNQEEMNMEKFSAMLRQSLADEHEAAADYTKRAAKCEKHGMEDAAKLFRDIAAEEVVHAGEFQALMEKYGILDQESIEQGEQEGRELLDGEKEEPEIDEPEVPAETAEEMEESVSEARGGENPAVHIIKKGTGNMNYSAKSMKDAIAYVKQQNLDLENGDYFDIHTGMNTSEPDYLDFWGGTGAGYWRNVVDNPRTKDRVKQMILNREVESLDQLHESAAAKNEDECPELLERIAQEVRSKLEEYYDHNEEALQYVFVEPFIEKGYYDDGTDMCGIEVRVEETYEGMSEIEELLDPIVQKYDNNAYFDKEATGILKAVLDLDEVSGKKEDAEAGTVASLGEAPTVVAGTEKDPKKKKVCKELRCLQEALEI